MTILELNFEPGWRGGEQQTLYNMQGFRDAGVSVTLLCRKGQPLYQKAVEAGFPVVAFYSVFGAFFYLIFKGRQFSILHAQTSHILTWCVLSKPFHKRKVLFTRRVAFIQKGFTTKWKYQHTDKIIAISDAVKANLENMGLDNVTVISDASLPKAADKKRESRFRYEFLIPPNVKVIATIAALGADKDPLTMIEAVRLLYKMNKNFVFLHFGSGPMEDLVKKTIEETGLKLIYKLIGFQDNVQDFFPLFDIYTMSSVQEGLGSSVLDAFLCRIPVAATNAGGLATLLTDGRGLLSPTGDAEQLAQNLLRLMQEPDLVRDITTKAYNYVESEHGITHITQQYLDLIAQM